MSLQRVAKRCSPSRVVVVYQLPEKPSDTQAGSEEAAGAGSGPEARSIPSWEAALQALPLHATSPRSDTLRGSALPPPSALEGSGNLKLYIGGWLATRAVHVANAFESILEPRAFPSRQQWKNFLNTLRFHFESSAQGNLQFLSVEDKRRRIEDRASAQASSSPRPPPGRVQPPGAQKNGKKKAGKKSSSASTGRHTRHEMLESLPLTKEKISRVAWLEKQLLLDNREVFERELSDDVVSEVMWELYELNFRLELLLLDQHLLPNVWKAGTADDRKRTCRDLTLRAVFPLVNRHPGSYFVDSIPNVNAGLASFDWRERARHVLALRDVVVEWPGHPDGIERATFRSDEHAMGVLEHTVVQFYCTTFHSYFGRPPVPPIRLPAASLRRDRPASIYGSLFAGPA